MGEFTVIINRSPLQFRACGIRSYTQGLLDALDKSPLRGALAFHDFGFQTQSVVQSGRRLLPRLLSHNSYLKVKNTLLKRSVRQALSRFSGGKVLYHETNNVPASELQVPYVTTVQDLTVFKFPDYHPPYRVQFFAEHFVRTLKSDLIIVPSHATKQDFLNDFGVPAEKIRVIPHGRNEFYQPIQQDNAQALTKKYVEKPFILFSGVIEPRKNLDTLLLAFARIRKRKNVALVLAGTYGWQYESIVQLSRRLGLQDVYFTNSITMADLRGLYNCAEVFVYPSLYEGFGFPPLEAMACGAPVVLSQSSSLPEVGGEAAIYVDPRRAESIVDATLRVLEDDQLRQSLRQQSLARSRQFSWDDTAAQMVRLYTDVIRKTYR